MGKLRVPEARGERRARMSPEGWGLQGHPWEEEGGQRDAEGWGDGGGGGSVEGEGVG